MVNYNHALLRELAGFSKKRLQFRIFFAEALARGLFILFLAS
jgi:hypothetical protein